MTLFFTVLGATALGTFSANTLLFWTLGNLAKRQEEQQKQALAKMQQDFIEMRQKEVERMKKYAEMEG